MLFQDTCISYLSRSSSIETVNFTFLPLRRCLSDSARSLLKSAVYRKSRRSSAFSQIFPSWDVVVSSVLRALLYSRLATVSIQLDKSGVSSIMNIKWSRKLFWRYLRWWGGLCQKICCMKGLTTACQGTTLKGNSRGFYMNPGGTGEVLDDNRRTGG